MIILIFVEIRLSSGLMFCCLPPGKTHHKHRTTDRDLYTHADDDHILATPVLAQWTLK